MKGVITRNIFNRWCFNRTLSIYPLFSFYKPPSCLYPFKGLDRDQKMAIKNLNAYLTFWGALVPEQWSGDNDLSHDHLLRVIHSPDRSNERLLFFYLNFRRKTLTTWQMHKQNDRKTVVSIGLFCSQIVSFPTMEYITAL